MKRTIVLVVFGLLLLGNLAVSAWTYHTLTNFTVHCYDIQAMTNFSHAPGVPDTYVIKETCQDNPLPQEP